MAGAWAGSQERGEQDQGLLAGWISHSSSVGSVALLSLLPCFPRCSRGAAPQVCEPSCPQGKQGLESTLHRLGGHHSERNHPSGGVWDGESERGKECWHVLAENICSVPAETEAGGSHIAHGRAGTASPSLQALHHPPLLAGWLQAPLCHTRALVVVSTQEGLGAFGQAGLQLQSPAHPHPFPVAFLSRPPSPLCPPPALGVPCPSPEPGPCQPSPGPAPSRIPWNGRDVGLVQPGQLLGGEGRLWGRRPWGGRC